MKQLIHMNSLRPIFYLLALLMGWPMVHSLSADDRADAAIERARAWLGAEEVLNEVQSVHYSGEIRTSGGDVGSVDIVFMKPNFQLIVAEVNNVRQTTALSGYDAWEKVEDMNNEDDWQLTLLEAGQIQRLQANAWEALYFYRVGRQKKVAVSDEGEAEIEGVVCDKVSFRHNKTIRFVRYFEVETGRLVLTETELGGQIREEGELWSGGIRFPKRLVTRVGENSSTIEFEVIEVNESFDEEIFDVPMFLPASGS